MKKHIRNMSRWLSLYMIRLGYHIDFELDSYEELDRFFNEYEGNSLVTDNEAYIFAIASYIGEVLRVVLGGRWCYSPNINKENVGDRDICIKLRDGRIIYPLEVVALRMQKQLLIRDIIKN